MIKRELKQLFLPVLTRFSFTFIFALTIWILKFDIADVKQLLLLFTLCLPYIIIWISNYLGSVAFKSEQRDNAYEYLLSFPLSRRRILFYKLIPGATILAALFLLYIGLYLSLLDSFILLNMPVFSVQDSIIGSLYYLLWVTFVFLSAFFVGFFDWKDFRIVINLVHLIFTFFISMGVKTQLMKINGMERSSANYICYAFGIIIVLSILAAAFFPVFRKFDVKSMNYHRKRFLFVALPPLGLLGAISVYLII